MTDTERSMARRGGGRTEPPRVTSDRSADPGASVLARAARSLAATNQEITELWRVAIANGDLSASQRLAHLSHALASATRALHDEPVIGSLPRSLSSPTERLRRHEQT